MDNITMAAEKLFDTASFEGAQLKHFIVTARPEVIKLIECAIRAAVMATDEMFVNDSPLEEADYQDVGRCMIRGAEKRKAHA